ncbi:hypothetical protein [Desulfobacter postgatei]|uniref:hypothetical protein n=1 Tax=Desulfobacter postgatei TaxID=2293 RepID=UPI00259BAABA|nr:hypothetical protein [uncultured Desulfobacter sp.]
MSANPLLFNAHALPVDNQDPHAQVGNHLRVNTHPLLGLPIAPFIVWRAVTNSLKGLNIRRDVVFRDKNGVLEPPFDVTPDNPVTAHIALGPGETCIWAQVEAIPLEKLQTNEGSPTITTGTSTPTVTRPTITGRRGSITSHRLTERRRLATAGSAALRPGPIAARLPGINTGTSTGSTPSPLNTESLLSNLRLRQPVLRFNPERFRPFLPKLVKTITCEAFVHSAIGPAPIGTRSEARYAFSAPGIIEIQIRGAGRVGAVSWIEASDVQHLKYEPFTIMNLPHKGGARYVPIINAKAIASQRVTLQTPKRSPLQETTDTPPPQTAPLWNTTAERDRVDSLTTTLDEDLEHLINDTSESQLQQQITEDIFNEHGTKVGQSLMKRLSRVFQSQSDPGTASKLGYKMLDNDWRETEERLVFYRIAGFFKDTPRENIFTEWSVDARIARLPEQQRNLNKDEILSQISALLDNFSDIHLDRSLLNQLEKSDKYFSVTAAAVADRGAPLDPIPAPVITNTQHNAWLPEVPPAAKREVVVGVAQVRVAGLLASGKRTPVSGPGVFENLNKKNEQGFHLPLVLALNVDDATGDPISAPGTGFIADRSAAAADIRYFIAQQDRFGRWSQWAGRNAAAGPRPKPPRPDFQAFYTQPAIADAATHGGEVHVRIPVPDKKALAPGSLLLDRLQLKVRDETTALTTTHHLPEASKFTYPDDPTTFFVEIKFAGPILQPTEQRRLHLTAFWINTANVLSDESEPQRLKLNDPRPPAQLPVPDQLQYSARPDVTGLAWVEHRWPPAAGQDQFGIYYTDENRLLAHLEAEEETALLEELQNAADAAARATLFRNHVHLYPDHLFERLRDVVVDFDSGEKGFRHGLSGSLRLLSFYKIAAEANTGARPELLNLPLIVYGIPNSDPPPRPVVQVTPDEPEIGDPDYVTHITITLEPGAIAGETWRLRRSSVESHNPWKMPIVETGALSPVDETSGQQTAEYRDTGPVQIASTARLKPWVRYSWVAEVQGTPESGSAAAGKVIPGRWSQASDPVSLVLVPDNPPDALNLDSVSHVPAAGGFGDVEITLTHPETLDGGAIGDFRLRVMRRLTKSSPLENLREDVLAGSSPFTISGLRDPAETIPADTEYQLQLIDPLGRSSDITHVIVS